MDALTTFFHQGGYALFVWGAYGMVLALFVLELALLRHEHHATLKRLLKVLRLRNQAGGW